MTAQDLHGKLFIGNNLDVLRGINSESVDLIYLDPPFCKQKKFAAPIGSKAAGMSFKDAWTLDDAEKVWLEECQYAEPEIWHVIRAAKAAHSEAMAGYLAFMLQRLRECQRVMKRSGSIYLHCDPTANSYLRVLMDTVFGAASFRNEIVWKRYGSHNDTSRRFGCISDTVLFYAGANATWNVQRGIVDPSSYTSSDFRGTYTTSPLHARSLSGGGYKYTWHEIKDVWKFPKDRLDELEADSRIHWPKRGKVPRRKVYLSESKGKPLNSIFDDIPIASGKERTGWPTQKPLALLERIIRASSNLEDLILDPFAGCATACVAAEKLGRKWCGIDIAEDAEIITSLRLSELTERESHCQPTFAMTECKAVFHPPVRTDEIEVRFSRNIRSILYKKQNGCCNGCKRKLPIDLLELDHIIPKSKGGRDEDKNAQLLCATCNRIKGNRPQHYLLAELKRKAMEQMLPL